MGRSFIGCKCCAKHLNEKILKYFSGSRSTTNEPNFKIFCNCIHELSNVFEDSVQRVHTIILVSAMDIKIYLSNQEAGALH